jgi:hypothetical protein
MRPSQSPFPCAGLSPAGDDLHNADVSLRGRYFLVLGFLPFLAAGCLALSFRLPGWWSLVPVLVWISPGIYLQTLRCPRCDKPIGIGKTGFARIVPERICSRCGCDLQGR